MNKRTRALLIFGSIIFLVVLMLSVNRCQQVHAPDPTGPLDDIPVEEQVQPKDSRIASYSRQIQDFIILLESAAYMDNNQVVTLEISDDSFIETSSTREEVTPFVVLAVETSAAEAVQTDGRTESYVASIEVGGKVGFLRLDRLSVDAVVYPWMLTCDFLQFATVYTSVAANVSFDVLWPYGGGEDIDRAAVQVALEDMVCKRFPAASEAVWSGVVSFDYSVKMTTTRFTLNNSAKTMLEVFIDGDTGEIVVEQVSR
jgi:hypothetical protein